MGPEGFGRVVQCLLALFYADNRILYYPWPYHLQVDLDVLAGLLNQVGLHINVTKIVCMVFQLF